MLEEAGNELVCPLRMVFPADGGQQRDYRVSSGSGSGSSNSAAFLLVFFFSACQRDAL